ncbi:ComF family protein [Candidatus Reidiella endopervernicosa]|uniref:ComF family protein n=1 Tax=Candidatus Reidiella endopervernicosa TaxID=2738883 RepID=A0A6N0I0M2_9GAMM|nr:ComF family protein [Candidatus Reidiella endopervernicosa]
MVQRIIDTTLPHHCLLCDSRHCQNQPICQHCHAALPVIKHACQQCGIPLKREQARCGRCIKKPPYYSTSTIPYHYEHPIDRLIQALKFDAKIGVAQLLGKQIAKQRLNHGSTPLPQCIIPVPLHRSRLRERGFNQSLEIARAISEHLDITLNYQSCQRNRPTATQTSLPAAQRSANLRNAFSAVSIEEVDHVAIVDDVVTTGHTANELARLLRRGGIKIVEVWAAARAGR